MRVVSEAVGALFEAVFDSFPEGGFVLAEGVFESELNIGFR